MSLNPALLIAGDFIVLRMALVDELGGDIEAAIALQRIAWRCEREGQWVATHDDIQAETRLSGHKVKRALAMLRERGYITSERASSWDPTQAWTVVLDSTSPDGGNHRHVPVETAATVPVDSPVTSSQDSETKTKTDSRPADAGPGSFDAFWQLVVRKTGRGACATKWAKLTLGDRLAAFQGMQLARAAWVMWPVDDQRFIPMPLTWLNQRRWEDEPPTARHQSVAERRKAAALEDISQDGSWARTGDGGWGK